MCGRYAASRDPDDLVEEFEVDQVEVPAPLGAGLQRRPTKEVYAVLDPRRAKDGPGPPSRRCASCACCAGGWCRRWAKDPSIGSRLINARMETVAEKPAFRRAFARRRCLLPADGYYEWYAPEGAGPAADRPGKAAKQPFFIHPKDGGVLAMAGLYEFWRDRTRPRTTRTRGWSTCTVLTTQAEDALGPHPRPDAAAGRARTAGRAWLDPTVDGRRPARGAAGPGRPGRLEAYPVSTAVNNVRNNGPELLEPLPAEDVVEGVDRLF